MFSVMPNEEVKYVLKLCVERSQGTVGGRVGGIRNSKLRSLKKLMGKGNFYTIMIRGVKRWMERCTYILILPSDGLNHLLCRKSSNIH